MPFAWPSLSPHALFSRVCNFCLKLFLPKKRIFCLDRGCVWVPVLQNLRSTLSSPLFCRVSTPTNNHPQHQHQQPTTTATTPPRNTNNNQHHTKVVYFRIWNQVVTSQSTSSGNDFEVDNPTCPFSHLRVCGASLKCRHWLATSPRERPLKKCTLKSK